MKKLITLIIIIVITTSCYAQDTIKIQRQQFCKWDDTNKRWYCWEQGQDPAVITLKNNIYYINGRHHLKYIIKGEGDVVYFNGCSSIIYKNVIDNKGEKCFLSIINYPDGDKTIYISYVDRQTRYYLNP
jgi:hypothetical protein